MLTANGRMSALAVNRIRQDGAADANEHRRTSTPLFCCDAQHDYGAETVAALQQSIGFIRGLSLSAAGQLAIQPVFMQN